MAKTKMRLRRIDTKIYHAVKTSWIGHKLSPQQSPRCTFMMLVSDESGSMRNAEWEEFSLQGIEELVEALKTVLEHCLRERPKLCTANRCDGHMYNGIKGAAKIIRLILSRRLDSFSGTRLLYDPQRVLKDRLRRSRISEKKKAEWYREGPPGNQVFCHTLRTVA